MALTANAQGVLTGKFNIPANVSAGSKSVEFKGSGGSHGKASFFGQGTLVENIMQKVISTTTTYYDPLAQTFFLDEGRQIAAVELFVVAKGTTPIVVHLRETATGFPTQTIIAETTLQASQVTTGQWNRFSFALPVTLLPGVEYAVVVMCNDAVAEIGIAEMGKFSLVSNSWVTSQPANVGVLLSSSNNSTWTAHQDRDMSFRLLAAKYTQTERIIDLGTVAANAHTDALILANVDSPVAGTGFSIDVVLPDNSVIQAGDSQTVSLLPAVTGNITLRAKVQATTKMSTALYPGTQMALGTLQPTADYVTRAFDADAASSAIRVRFDANLPSGSNARVYLSGAEAPDVWVEVAQNGSAINLGDGIFEYQFLKTDFNKAKCKVKIVLTGTNAARPRVMNLRVSVT